MQDYALTVDRFLDHGAKWRPGARVVTASEAGEQAVDYAGLRERANRLSGALLDSGLQFGDRIATLAWNTQHHMEVWYAAMGAGLVCHTLNPRIALHHLAVMVTQAQDRVLAVGAGLGKLGAELMSACPSLERLILLDGEPAPKSLDRGVGLEAFLAARGRPATWGAFDEQALAGLCFTSGTTGPPKGVAYTHRSNYLHTIRSLQADAFALTEDDVVLVAVPMFHANAWGLPFAAPAVGASMILPGRALDGASLARLIADHQATVAVGVPTVWLSLLDHLDAVGGETPSLERVVVGGASCPDALLARMESRLGVSVQTSWGMTELSPLGVISPIRHSHGGGRGAGRAPMGLDMLLTDADGRPLPQQRNVEGHLKVRGHSVVQRYFDAADTALDADGWFDTGDLAILDEAGNLTLAGRAKDLIKSGGEWINPIEIEEIVGALPAVNLVAVIGKPDPKWGERPLLVIQPAQGQEIDDQAIRASLKGRVADWWIPDEVVRVESMPLAATGKIDKIRLRAAHGGGGVATAPQREEERDG